MIPFLVLAQLAMPNDTLRFRPEDIDALPATLVRVDEHAGRLVIELPLVTVPANGMIVTPVYRVPFPLTVSLYAFDATLIDEHGNTIPVDRLHHFVLTDAQRRNLFLPLALPIFAASTELHLPVLPKYLIGVSVVAGMRYIGNGMFVNPEPRARRMQLRISLSFVRPNRIVPLLTAYPWSMDVMYPLGGAGGRHDFDLPPGRSSRSWTGSPAIAGRIVAMGGHAHDYATAMQLLDATSGETIWHQVPMHDAAGRIVQIPIARFYRWYRVGIHIAPTHSYRLTVWYDNPTGMTIPFGGMGSVAGLFVPDRGSIWPGVDPNDAIYRAQINNLLTNMAGTEMGEMTHGHH